MPNILQARSRKSPWHAWAFDSLTGINDVDPGIQLKGYPIVVKDGTIFIDINSRA